MPALAASMAGLAQVIRSGMTREASESTPLPRPATPVLLIPSMGTASPPRPLVAQPIRWHRRQPELPKTGVA